MSHGADPDLGDIPAIIAAVSFESSVHNDILALIVQSGSDLNLISKDGEYAVTQAAQGCYKPLLYLLESGACYDPATIPGGELQRILYESYDRCRKYPSMFTASPDLTEVIAWLEQRGVSFDKPLPPGTIKPEPFRVNNKLLEMRKKKAA